MAYQLQVHYESLNTLYFYKFCNIFTIVSCIYNYFHDVDCIVAIG